MLESYLISSLSMIVFFKATINESNILKSILASYEEALGQAINFQKSQFFCSRNVAPNVKSDVENILGVQQVLGTCKCLSLPSMIGRSRKATFKYVKHIIWKKNKFFE